MFSASYRFHGYNSLNSVYRSGKTIRGSVLLLRYGRNLKRKKSRVAVVVSKKISKSAVVRNRIRRRVYASAKPYVLCLPQAFDLVFTVLDEKTVDIDFKDLNRLIEKQLTEVTASTSVI